MDVVEVVAAALVGYLIGTFPTADLVTRLATRGRVDIRAEGSGNPGGLNAMKVVGAKWGVFVIVVDILKGSIGALAGWLIGGEAGAYAAASTVIAGHVFPVWSRFRGGKGVATSGGAVLVVFPIYFPIEVAVAGVGALSTRNAERAALMTGPLWIGSALAWWLADLPNLWGPTPTIGLPISATVSALMIGGKFLATRNPVTTAPAP